MSQPQKHPNNNMISTLHSTSISSTYLVYLVYTILLCGPGSSGVFKPMHPPKKKCGCFGTVAIEGTWTGKENGPNRHGRRLP